MTWPKSQSHTWSVWYNVVLHWGYISKLISVIRKRALNACTGNVFMIETTDALWQTRTANVSSNWVCSWCLMSVLRHPLGHLWTVRHILVPEEHIRDQLNNKYSTYGLGTYCFHGTIGYDRCYGTSFFIPNALFIWIFCIKNIIWYSFS